MKRPEEQIHRAVISHMQQRAMPGVFYFHPANGGWRSKAEGGILKAMGVRAGLPDLIIFYRAQIFGLELKASYGRLSPAQRQTLNDMEVAGARTHIAHSLDEALVTLECWGVIRREANSVIRRVPEVTGTAGGAMNRPWMPLYIGDYLGDTGHLTTTQHGAYFLLMMHYWRKGGLPNDDKQLAKITKLPLKVWAEYRDTLQDFFHENDGDPWRHKRIDAELFKTTEISAKRANAGHLGGMRSALARMKLENASLSKHVPRQAIADQLPSKCVAKLDYSQSQSKKEGLGNEESAKPPHAATASDLAEIYAKRKVQA